MRAPAPTLLQLLPRALRLAGLIALVPAILYLATTVTPTTVGTQAAAAARVGLVCFAIALGVLMVFLQRAWQDRAFTLVGLGATFFGLGMLLFFFTRLGLDVARYFAVAPALIEGRNEELQGRVRRAEQIHQEALATARREMEIDLAGAADAAEKREIREFYEKEVLPARARDLKITEDEAKIEAAKGVRPDTSTAALLGHFLTHGPSDQPQDVGILPALCGSLWVALITVLFAVPVGVGAALYLEEYRSNSWLGTIIQVNINNLAGIPSVVYGILGAFVFVELIFKPLAQWYPGVDARNVLGGGLTLGLLTLPVIIVAAQEAIRAVPSSVRQGAYALGATRWQVTRHQVLPMALPGILTGAILALSRAIGEAAPLVLFGALQFVDQQPSPLSRFTVLPLQIFGWAERPPIDVPGYDTPMAVGQMIAALTSVLLLLVLLCLNGAAIYLRNRAQQQPQA